MNRPRSLHEMLDPEFWARMNESRDFEYQTPLFQPVGGMDAIPRALARAVGPKIRYRARVTEISQDDQGVVARYEDMNHPGQMHTARAQWCVCTLPLSILSQLEVRVGEELRNAIQSVPYFAAAKVGLQFKRRFWEEDEAIYGGISLTDLPIMQIGYPNHNFHGRKGVLLGAYTFGTNAYEFAAMSPEQRVRETVRLGTQIHKQYPAEFENGIAVAWHRSPFTLGCFGWWTEETRARHYPTMLKMDGRIILAGEHASLLTALAGGRGALCPACDHPAAQEGGGRMKRIAVLLALLMVLPLQAAEPEPTLSKGWQFQQRTGPSALCLHSAPAATWPTARARAVPAPIRRSRAMPAWPRANTC